MLYQRYNRSRTRWLFALALTPAILVTTLCASPAQAEYTIVFELYREVMLYPESGDQLINQNSQLYDQRFYTCLDDRMAYLTVAATNHYRWCDEVHSNPRFRSQCYNDNDPAKMHSVLRDIRAAATGQAAWSESFNSQVARLGKSLMPDLYMQLTQAVMPVVRPYLLCQ